MLWGDAATGWIKVECDFHGTRIRESEISAMAGDFFPWKNLLELI